MNYFVKETINGDPNAGSKARNDVSDIMEAMGWNALCLDFVFNEKLAEKKRGRLARLKENLKLRMEWAGKLKEVGAGDVLLIQFPVLRRPALLFLSLRRFVKRGGKVILLIHDLEILRFASRQDVSALKSFRIGFEEKPVLRLADRVIVHNEKMREKLVQMGFEESRMVDLKLFDYLIPGFDPAAVKRSFEPSAAIAGNLRPHKTKYLRALPDNVIFELYGIGYEDQGQQNVHYHGAFPPDLLPMEMQAGFGLVWDGESADSCTGTYGEYMRINNPHKTSLYLASGIPVIIWKEAALAGFIEENGLGFGVESLPQIADRLAAMTEEEYSAIQKRVAEAGKKLRDGAYLRTAVEKALAGSA